MKKEFQEEYELYMKSITDSFMLMNGDSINSEWNEETSVFYEVIWSGGINYSIDLNCSLAGKGITLEEMKKLNAETSKKYLKENAITYNEWFQKYKNNK